MRDSKDYVITGTVVLITLGFLELGLRVAGVKFEPSLYEPHPVLSAVLRPNAEGWTMKEGENYVRINSLGMRDRERTIESSPRTIRAAFLGDSQLAAEQVALEKTMSQILEQRLSRAASGTGRQVEVLNFGVGGYALSQMYLLLDERVWAFHPDMVVVFVSQLTVPNSYRRTKSLVDLPLFTVDDGHLIVDPGNQAPAGTSAQSLHWHKSWATSTIGVASCNLSAPHNSQTPGKSLRGRASLRRILQFRDAANSCVFGRTAHRIVQNSQRPGRSPKPSLLGWSTRRTSMEPSSG